LVETHLCGYGWIITDEWTLCITEDLLYGNIYINRTSEDHFHWKGKWDRHTGDWFKERFRRHDFSVLEVGDIPLVGDHYAASPSWLKDKPSRLAMGIVTKVDLNKGIVYVSSHPDILGYGVEGEIPLVDYRRGCYTTRPARFV
jgi:hypothetical protein